MDPTTVLTTVTLGAILQSVIIVLLYQFWIIPRIVEKTQSALIEKIDKCYEQLNANLRQEVADSVQVVYENLVRFISGGRGTDSRQMTLARNFLDRRLPSDSEDLDAAGEELATQVITQAVLKYGKGIVDAVIGSVRPKLAKKAVSDAQKPADEGVAVW